jgi:hypothetical protein
MTLPETYQKTIFTTLPHAGGDPGRLSAIHETALDLYRRGLNVFPLPSPWEWRAWQRAAGETVSHKKPPYVIRPLFTSRMSLNADWLFLFDRANIGLVMGRTSGNAFAVDCDSPAAFNRVGRELLSRGLPYWAIRSHRGGSFLMRLAEGEAANADTLPGWPAVQVWGNAHYMVLPPSIHPSGEYYEWVTPDPRSLLGGDSIPLVHLAALEWLGVELHKARGKWEPAELQDLPAWAAVLSRENRRILANGAKCGARNSKLVKPAYDLAANDIPYQNAEAVFLRAAARCDPPYPETEALAVLKSAYRKQNAQPARKAGGVRLDILKAEDAVSAFDWRSHFRSVANKRRALFLACIERAKHEGGEVWRASVRELSELAAQGVNGVRAGLAALQSADLVKFVGVNETGAHLYKFGKAVSSVTPGDTVIPPCSNSVSPGVTQKTDIPATQAEQNLFNRLGLNAWHVWRFVCNAPADKATIARALNIPRSSLARSLQRLTADNIRLVTFGPAERLFENSIIGPDDGAPGGS